MLRIIFWYVLHLSNAFLILQLIASFEAASEGESTCSVGATPNTRDHIVERWSVRRSCLTLQDHLPREALQLALQLASHLMSLMSWKSLCCSHCRRRFPPRRLQGTRQQAPQLGLVQQQLLLLQPRHQRCRWTWTLGEKRARIWRTLRLRMECLMIWSDRSSYVNE